MAEATADPALDQANMQALGQIEVHPLVDGVMNIDLAGGGAGGGLNEGNGFRIGGLGGAMGERGVLGGGGGGGGGVLGGGGGLGNVVNFNPPGSPQLRPAINPNEPYPDQIPHDDN